MEILESFIVNTEKEEKEGRNDLIKNGNKRGRWPIEEWDTHRAQSAFYKVDKTLSHRGGG